VSARVPGLGDVKAVTMVTGETKVIVYWPRGTYGHTPATARELAAALLAVADEAEAIDAAAAGKPVQETLDGEVA
jgi:hypothetical protein